MWIHCFRMGQRGSRDERNYGDGAGDDDVKRQVDSDVNHLKPIYQLVNVKTGGGKLIDLIKTRARNSSGSSFASQNNSINHSRQQQQQLDVSTDQQIRELVEPLLYNGGRGKLVPLVELWRHRLGRVSRQQSTGEQDFSNDVGNKLDKLASKGPDQAIGRDGCERNSRTDVRWVCWKLEERGFVGETALHICFLLSSQTHMILAKKLLKLFPMLINDIYTCDEYFGESSLHMAIVNENVRIVKLLLDHGANVHERCLGSFFLPNDLKDKANGAIKRMLSNSGPGQQQQQRDKGSLSLDRNHFSNLVTDYSGYTYWGEYPLSFAVSLGLVDCYRLLLAKGADPNRQDSIGNSTLHIAVLADRIDMFNLSYENGASLDLVNCSNLSPLALAAKLRRVDMFYHILTLRRRVNWVFCNVAFVETPLEGIDSINTTDGSCDENSVLSIVVSGHSDEHLQMLDGLLEELLHIKWNTSTRKRFQILLYSYLLFLVLSFVAYITRIQADRMMQFPTQFQHSTHHSRLVGIQMICESFSILYVVCYIFLVINRLVANSNRHKSDQHQQGSPLTVYKTVRLLEALTQAPELALFSITCLLIIICVPFRLMRMKQAEDTMVALIVFSIPVKLLFYCRSSRSLGPYILMIYKIAVNDFLRFFLFSMLFVLGFAQSFIIVFKTHKSLENPQNSSSNMDYRHRVDQGNPTEAQPSHHVDGNFFNNPTDVFISMLMMALNEFSQLVDQFDSTNYPHLARLLFCNYMILVSILLVNTLIAMLGKTYQDVASQPNENLRQWARALLRIERLLSNEDRLKVLDNYSHKIWLQQATNHRDRELLPARHHDDKKLSATNDRQGERKCRCLSSTWGINENDLAAIELVRGLNQANKMNAKRLASRGERKTQHASQDGPP